MIPFGKVLLILTALLINPLSTHAEEKKMTVHCVSGEDFAIHLATYNFVHVFSGKMVGTEVQARFFFTNTVGNGVMLVAVPSPQTKQVCVLVEATDFVSTLGGIDNQPLPENTNPPKKGQDISFKE